MTKKTGIPMEAVLYRMVQEFPDCDYWNDSCAEDELLYAIERGATGATTNPVIVKNVLKKEMPFWRNKIQEIADNASIGSEEDVAWAVIEMIAQERSKLLLPVYERFQGKKGRISVQTNPRNYRNAAKMLEQATHFDKLASNIQVKIPCSAAGVQAMEEATYRGISINSTVCFTVAQAVAVAEAVERGMARRQQEGLPTQTMSPVCTLMFGRVEDYFRQYCLENGYMLDPISIDWTAVAIFKRTYQIYQERGYTTRLLASGPRHFNHWSQIIGGNYAMTINHTWQERINNSGFAIRNTVDDPVDQDVLDRLYSVPEFVLVYDETALSINDFEHFGAFRLTLSSFLSGYDELLGIIRDFMLPDPFKK